MSSRRFVRKDVIMASLIVVFIIEAVLYGAGLVPAVFGTKLVDVTILVTILPMVLIKKRSRRFSNWLETRI